jgi:hypothetical protein
MRWSVASNAPEPNDQRSRFRIIHVFHPLVGHEFELVTYRHNWGEDRAYFHDRHGSLASVPASWTDLLPLHPFVAVASGRCLFRPEDLLRLARLLEEVGR